jgi:hypothetical protein
MTARVAEDSRAVAERGPPCFLTSEHAGTFPEAPHTVPSLRPDVGILA